MNKNQYTGFRQPEQEPLVKEFITRPPRYKKQISRRRRFWEQYGVVALAVSYLVLLILVLLLDIFVCRVPAGTAVLVTVLESLLALCLIRVPLWLHGMILVLLAAAGFLSGLVLFLILAAGLYAAMIAMLKLAGALGHE